MLKIGTSQLIKNELPISHFDYLEYFYIGKNTFCKISSFKITDNPLLKVFEMTSLSNDKSDTCFSLQSVTQFTLDSMIEDLSFSIDVPALSSLKTAYNSFYFVKSFTLTNQQDLTEFTTGKNSFYNTESLIMNSIIKIILVIRSSKPEYNYY